MPATLVRARLLVFLTGVLTLAAAKPAAAGGLTLMWDPSSDPSVAGYVVYVGTQSGAYQNTYDVGSATGFSFTSGTPGQRYYFAVASYAAGPVIGLRSAEVSAVLNAPPLLTNPGNQTTTVNQVVTLQLTGSDPEGAAVTYGAVGLPQGLQLNATTGFISGSPSTAGSFVVTASVTDGVLSSAKTFTWTVLQATSSSTAPVTSSPTPSTSSPAPSTSSPTPTSAPSINSAPTLNNPGPQTSTLGRSVTVQLTGGDPDGTSIRFGASGLPPGLRVETGNGQIYGAPLAAGTYLVTATVTDGALSDAETFTWTIMQSGFDTVAPTVTITLPTSAATYTTDQAFVTVGGTATDDGGVAEVTWATDRGLAGSASGAENWIAGIPLLPGSNLITIRARDASGNVAARAVVVKVQTSAVSKPAIVQRGRRTGNTD